MKGHGNQESMMQPARPDFDFPTYQDGGWKVREILSTINPWDISIHTLEVTLPRIVLAEFNTHKLLSRNSASSRAIPVHKQIEKVLRDPYVPRLIGANIGGMQAKVYLEGDEYLEAVESHLQDRDQAVYGALQKLLGLQNTRSLLGERGSLGQGEDAVLRTEEGIEAVLGALREFVRVTTETKHDRGRIRDEGWLNVHKQTANRNLEPFLWHTILVTATEWSNFIALRDHPDADPNIQFAAALMRQALEQAECIPAEFGEWHAPLLARDERELLYSDDQETREYWIRVSAARSGRVSYETHDGVRDPDEDLRMYQRLESMGHMSPMEHPAVAEAGDAFIANFRGWKQLRKFIPYEDDFSARLEPVQH